MAQTVLYKELAPQILAYSQQGLSSRKIAAKLGTSKHTVLKAINRDKREKAARKDTIAAVDNKDSSDVIEEKLGAAVDKLLTISPIRNKDLVKTKKVEDTSLLDDSVWQQVQDRKKQIATIVDTYYQDPQASYAEIGEKLGLTRKQVGDIIRGELRASGGAKITRRDKVVASNTRRREEKLERVRAALNPRLTISEVAKIAKVGEKTIYNAINDGYFSHEDFLCDRKPYQRHGKNISDTTAHVSHDEETGILRREIAARQEAVIGTIVEESKKGIPYVIGYGPQGSRGTRHLPRVITPYQRKKYGNAVSYSV